MGKWGHRNEDNKKKVKDYFGDILPFLESVIGDLRL